MEIPYGGVAFFDSGIGGLTVLAECRKQINNEIFYYYGDNARAPYGNRSEEEITGYVEEAFETFCRLRVKAVVVACNTATAVCIEGLRKKYPFPIIGAEPALMSAAKEGGEILILSTCATSKSSRLAKLQEKTRARYPDASFCVFPCETLAAEIERHVLEKEYSYLPFLPSKNPAAVVLGCTHYVYIKKQVQAFYQCPVFDGNEGIAKRLRWMLSTHPNRPILQNNRDNRPLVTTARPPQNFYLGNEKTQNKHVFEQMFGK